MFQLLFSVLSQRTAFRSLPALQRYKLIAFGGFVVPYTIALPIMVYLAKYDYQRKIGKTIPPGVQWMYMGMVWRYLPKEGDGLERVKGG